MPLMMLKKYWMEIAIVLALTLAYGYIKSLIHEKVKLEDENALLRSRMSEKEAYITAQNIAIEANKVEYLKNLNRLPTVIKEIETQYKTKYQTIYEWRDSNETNDCNESMRYLDSFQF